MKLQPTDRRLAGQFITVGLLIVLPVTMIVVNGTRTIYAILMPDAGAAAPAAEPRAATLSKAARRFGVYDPAGVFSQDRQLALRHVYVSWAQFDEDRLAANLKSLEERGHQVLLTVEPWPLEEAERPLLDGIVQGDYDPSIARLARVLNQLEGPVLISWGHEMDQDLAERYPWSAAEPAKFVAAYRYVVDRFRQQVETPLEWIWAGVLKEGSLQYWPGEKYADFVGMPIYSWPAWDQKTYGYIRDFSTTFEEKRRIVAELQKPLIITELGVSGSPDFESFWLRQAFLALEDYPDLAAVVFFHSQDTEGAWGRDMETPDWRMHPEAIRGLVDWHLQQQPDEPGGGS